MKWYAGYAGTNMDGFWFVADDATADSEARIADQLTEWQAKALASQHNSTESKLHKRTEALEGMLEKYVALVNCGDCGNWNPEEEPVVIAAREALSDD